MDGIREELEKSDLKKYVNSILTAHVMKRPPDHEAGLALLLRLRGTVCHGHADVSCSQRPTESDPQLVEDAVKYIIFLVDADRLFDTALGMYDFSLVLMVAQHAQKVCLLACSHPLCVSEVADMAITGPQRVPSFPAGAPRP